MNINTMIKNASSVLFTDCDHFNKEITGVKNLNDIRDRFNFSGRVTQIGFCGNEIEYRLINTDYTFSITLIN